MFQSLHPEKEVQSQVLGTLSCSGLISQLARSSSSYSRLGWPNTMPARIFLWSLGRCHLCVSTNPSLINKSAYETEDEERGNAVIRILISNQNEGSFPALLAKKKKKSIKSTGRLPLEAWGLCQRTDFSPYLSFFQALPCVFSFFPLFFLLLADPSRSGKQSAGT